MEKKQNKFLRLTCGVCLLAGLLAITGIFASAGDEAGYFAAKQSLFAEDAEATASSHGGSFIETAEIEIGMTESTFTGSKIAYSPANGEAPGGKTAGAAQETGDPLETTETTKDESAEECAAPAAGEEKLFTILHTNDEHSAVIPHSPAIDYLPGEEDPTTGGFARLASAIEDIRSQKEDEGEPVLLFNAGDFIGGGAFGWMAPKGATPDPELAIMQKIGYDAVTIGNHEYDYGPDILADYLMAAGYPEAHDETLVLASNTEAPPEHPLAKNNLYRNSGIIELENGLKVGTFGLIGNQAILVASRTGEVEFGDQHDAARQAIEELEEQGADVIVALTHSGIPEDRQLARSVDGIDVIVGGHCHTAIEPPIEENDTLIVQAGAYVEYLGCLELAYDTATGGVRVRNEETGRPFLSRIDASYSPQENTASLVDDYLEELNSLVRELTDGEFEDIYETVARADFEIEDSSEPEETPVGNFVTDAMRLFTEEVTGERVDVALQTSGSVRRGIMPGKEHAPGEISFYEITEAIGIGYGEDGYPGYPIASFYLTGSDLYWLLEASAFLGEGVSNTSFLQASGIRYSYDPHNAVMFSIPYFDIPVPSLSVVNPEIYTGEGLQPAGDAGSAGLEADVAAGANIDNGAGTDAGAYKGAEAMAHTGGETDEGAETMKIPGTGGTISGTAPDAVNVAAAEQNSAAYKPLKRDDTLYHIACGTSLMSYIKMAADMIPLIMEPKDARGDPIDLENPEEYLVYREDGREFKLWEAVVEHAAAQPQDDEGIAQIPDYYRQSAGRINKESAFPHVVYFIGIVALLAAFIILLVRRRRRIKRQRNFSSPT